MSDHDTLAVCSVRYACGRMTYIVGDVVRAVSRLDIQPGTAMVIGRDVARAIREGHAGMDCDVKEWQGFVDYLAARYPGVREEIERDARVFPGIDARKAGEELLDDVSDLGWA